MKDLFELLCYSITQFAFMHLNYQTFKRVDKRMFVTSSLSHSFTAINFVIIMHTGQKMVCGFSDDINGRTAKRMWGIRKETRCRMN